MQKETIGLAVVAAALTVVNFFIQPMLFRPIDQPPPTLLPAFIFLGFWDALGFGVGVAFLIYLAASYQKWPKNVRGPLLAMFFIALWFSVLNWVHDGLHEAGASPPNWLSLALVEYGFHFPWLIFAGVLVFAAIKLAKTYQEK